MSGSPKTLNDVRKSFLEFFKSKGHEVIQSSPLLPHNDPTLMFTNAGMVQFKNVFVGKEELKGKGGEKVRKAATSQKCVRAGGKHNDLENVGYTARHHTFFEMLGNFSFGNYFKEDAIAYAWEYLTKVVKLPKEKLMVTVYHTDDEAFNLWKKIAGLPDEKIIRIASDDNFWAMGDTGPCGPCSEIFYDHGPSIAGGPPGSADADGDRFIEIWNLVFMQYEKHEDGTQTNLPKPCIDTGMGLERITAILQGVHDNYEIDIFQKLIEASQNISKRTDAKYLTSHRVIADHLRSSCFLIADGILPSNEGRGYVLRRIMRRAMRHCHMLDSKHTWFYKLIPALIEQIGQAYPELLRAESLLTQTLQTEEEKFRETLASGLKILETETKNLKSGGVLKGDVAFKLYDTYGFPLDLTQDILKAKNIKVDNAGFEVAMEKQRDQARSSWAGSGDQATSDIWLNLAKKGSTEFLGYSTLTSRAEIISIIANDKEVKSVKSGEAVILTNQTPFYGESGGQAGDKGIIYSDKFKFEVDYTRKFGGLHAHFGKIISGEAVVNQDAYLEVNRKRRDALRRNHSATHLLNAALRRKLGDHISQKGSLVEEDYLRFDFSHQKSMSKEELLDIEREVNEVILQNAEATTRVMPIKQAMESGAVAMFGEKYGEEVRVLSIGNGDNHGSYSIEFCGGTHVSRTGDIGLFKIIKESAVASGVRRIEAVTGDRAVAYIQNREGILYTLQDRLKTSPEDFDNRISALMAEKKSLENQISDMKKKLAMGGGGSSSKDSGTAVENINGVNFIGQKLVGIEAKDLRGLIDEYKKKYDNSVIVLIAENEGKASIASGVSEKLITKYSAVDFVKKASEAMGGKGGGGRPDFAQGGAASADNANSAIEEVRKLISEKTLLI